MNDRNKTILFVVDEPNKINVDKQVCEVLYTEWVPTNHNSHMVISSLQSKDIGLCDDSDYYIKWVQFVKSMSIDTISNSATPPFLDNENDTTGDYALFT